MNLRCYIAAVFIGCVTFDAFSQSPFFRKHPLPLEYKNAGISCFIQDHQRYLWYGTTIGVVRFDGTSYKYFMEFPLQDNHVTALYEDTAGTIWIGYDNGKIGRINGEKFQDSAVDSIHSPITGFAADREGNVWASTYGEGIRIISGNTVERFSTTEGLNDDFVYAIASDKSGNVYAGTDHGVSIFTYHDGKRSVKTLNNDNGLKDNIITSLAIDQSGKLWTGSESAGPASYDPGTKTFFYPHDQWRYGRVASIACMGNTIWAGTAMNGLIEVHAEGEFTNVINEEVPTLPKRITDLMTDAEGNIWVASGAGFVHSGHPLFSFISGFSGNQAGNIQAILYSRTGNIMFSTVRGVWMLKPHANGSGLRRLMLPGMENVQVISLFEDKLGYIWLGTFDKGVYRYHPETNAGNWFTERDGLVNNNVLSIAGSENEVWLATLGGVSQCNADVHNSKAISFRNYTSESGLGSNYIYKIFVDSRKRVWFATDGKGVSVMDKGVFRNFSLNEGLRSNIIYSVTEDAAGQIWISTSNTGIYRFNANAFESFTPHNGLRDLAISSIIGEKNGNILIVSRQGIDVLDPKSGAVFYHGQEFGITDIDPNLNAYTVDRDGNVWMGSQAGIIKYNTNINPLPKWPVTMIKEMQIFLSKADSTDTRLSHNQNHISFDYIGFWYHDPEEVSYRIKLEGHDREWVNSKNNFITYPNLPPGEYTFKVMSSATNHFEGAHTETYRFSIAPPFYNTIWFYSLTGLFLMFLGFVFVRNREKRLKAQQLVEKEKITFQFETLKNQVNPHFLFNSFNTLIGVIEEDRETAIEYVMKLSDFYRDILVNREKEVIPLGLELEMINNYYFLQMKRYKENFRLVVNVPPEKLNAVIPPLTLQLLVENAVKHNTISRDRPLEVEIAVNGDYLSVRNNIQRKITHEPSTGLGLANIISRFKLLTDKPVLIEETEHFFTVSIPLINSGV